MLPEVNALFRETLKDLMSAQLFFFFNIYIYISSSKKFVLVIGHLGLQNSLLRFA